MTTRYNLLALFFIVLWSSQCATPTPRKEPLVKDKVQTNPETEDPFFEQEENIVSTQSQKEAGILEVEHGIASWYGKEWQGHPTASGELFDMQKMTAAHPTLPMGSVVLVRNVENKKKCLVKINDRGPYIAGRIIDVSYAVAKQLDFVVKGTTQVEVELIEEGKNNFEAKASGNSAKNIAADDFDEELSTLAKADYNKVVDLKKSDYNFWENRSPNGYTVRTAAFKIKFNAEKYRAKLEEKYAKKVYIGTKGDWNFVWIGDFSTSEEAKKFYEKLKIDGLDVMSPDKVL